MLIISQDKRSIVVLENITQIYMEKSGEKDTYCIYCDYGVGITKIAEYSSEERCVKELSMFAAHYPDQKVYKIREE